MNNVDVYLEVGKKQTFAGALDWPGWCRSGRDSAAALQALFEYGPRYVRAIQPARLGFQAPADPAELSVVEQLPGSATTDFGAPDQAPAGDAQPVDESDLLRLQALLQACWQAFDETVKATTGKELRKGPRGGGRDLDKIVQHVLAGEGAYLSQLGWKNPKDRQVDPGSDLEHSRQMVLTALAAAAHAELPVHKPRGGLYWTPRYFVRRAAWHVLDHVWEIEDRVL